MHGRISIGLSMILLTLSSAGCLTTNQNQNSNQSSKPAVAEKTPATQTPTYASSLLSNEATLNSKPKKEDGPKRNPLPTTEISYGQLKEAEAESEGVRKNPEVQAQFRDQARLAYQRALQIDPNCLEASRHLGRLYTKTGDYDRAIEIYQKVMTKLPKDAALWFDLGQCHHRRKDFNESARCFQKALELDPENRDYLKRYGLTLAWIGQTEQGLIYLTRAQGAALAHVNIAGLMLTRGRHDLAMHHVQLALRENQQLPAALDLLARLEGGPTGAPQ